MFLSIKNVPKVSWSSDKPFNLKPKISTSFFLCFGLILFGLGEGLLIVSAAGASPWSVLAQGIHLNINLSVGITTILISIVVLLFWFPLNQKPGVGTILNALIIGLMIDVCIKFVPTPENYISQLLLAIMLYYSWTGWGNLFSCKFRTRSKRWINDRIAEKNKSTFGGVRGSLEITVMSIGWYLGGTVGIGTLLFAFGIGPAVALGLFIVGKTFN